MINDIAKFNIPNWNHWKVSIVILTFPKGWYEIGLWNPYNKKYSEIRTHRVITFIECAKLTLEIIQRPLYFYKLWK